MRGSIVRIALSIAMVLGGGIFVGSNVATQRASAAGPDLVYTYEVRGLSNSSDLEAFAAQAAETLNDPRGWSLNGSIAFQRVPSSGSFTLWLAAASTLPSFGSPCSTSWSCRQGRNVIINETRWLEASPAWNAAGGPLREYRHMVVNHETGHWLGFGHAFCSGAGAPAPVMQQQSISLGGCRFNAWPLPWERERVAATRGVRIRVGDPIGALDIVGPWLGGVQIGGWTIDPDTTGPGQVLATVDGTPTVVIADAARPDVGAAYPAYGPAHGFAAAVPASPGMHQVCIAALNVAGDGTPALLGCRSVVVGSPFGALDVVQAGPRTVRAAGWVIEPLNTAPVAVHLYVDGVGVPITADAQRPDIGPFFPDYGSGHGFDALLAAGPGQHRVCAYALDEVAPGTTTTLGCRDVVIGGSPTGNLELVEVGPRTVTVAGWALDRDTASPTSVHVYVDDAGTAIPADLAREDVATAFPLFGAGHGFAATVPVSPGDHTVCAYAIDAVAPGTAARLGCRRVAVGGTPIGRLESVTTGPGSARVAGWTIDPDTPNAGQVHVYVDGVPTRAAASGLSRPDIAWTFPAYGFDHGFAAEVPVGPGSHDVCVYAIDVLAPGVNPLLGCRSVVVGGSPFGFLEQVETASSAIRVSGWAIDPDTASPIQVHLYVDADGTATDADRDRSDLATAFPGYGGGHGFDLVLPATPGGHRVCAYAIDAAGGGSNRELGCRVVTVPAG